MSFGFESFVLIVKMWLNLARLVKIILSCLTWNLSILSKTSINVQNLWSFAEALELSLKFWAGCLPAVTQPWVFQPYGTEPPTEPGFTGQAWHCAAILQLIHAWHKWRVQKELLGYRRFWKQNWIMYARMLSSSWI